jgi:hypothetical protein
VPKSLSIFNFSVIKQISDDIIIKYDTVHKECIVEFLLLFFILIACWWIGRKILKTWRNPLLVILCLFTFRLFFIYNPFCWIVYDNLLDAKDVGWRQRDIIRYEYEKYLTRNKVKYLAVGTSQTGAIYGTLANESSKLGKFSLAGMSPLDFVLYREHIFNFNPDYVLLYVSEFDIARFPNYSIAKIGPAQKHYFPRLVWRFLTLTPKYVYKKFIGETSVGEIFPEYKYGFVFRGLINKLFKKGEALQKKDITQISEKEYLKIHLQNLEKNLTDKGIEFNTAFLEEFISMCDKRNINVVLVEGQYNPLGYSEKNLHLNSIVRKKLLKLSDQYKNTIFISRDKVFEFKQEDYKDGYHVTLERGKTFARQLIQYLEGNMSSI